MADERIDIELNDKMSPDVEKKFLGIAKAAQIADLQIKSLSASLSKVGSKEISSIAASQSKVEMSTVKTASAMAKLEQTSARTSIVMAKLATAENNAAKSAASLASAQSRAAASASRASAAADRAALAHLRLEQAQARAAKGSSGGLVSSLVQARNQFLAVAAAAKTAYEAVQIMDSYVNMENRLRATGLAGEELSSTMKKLIGISVDSRSDLKGTVELYSRLALSTRNLGYDQKQLMTFTTALNKSILMSGATTVEANNALIQLSQGMSSGVLRGDELRSVLEQLPVVADIIAKGMGTTRDQLRDLGKEGKITTDKIMKGFLEAAPVIEQGFSEQVITAGQAMTVLKTRVTEVLGEEGGDSLKSLVDTIMDLSDAVADSGPVFEKFLFGVASTIKILHVGMLGLEAFFQGFPLMYGTIGQAIMTISATILGAVTPIAELFAFMAPDQGGNALVAMLNDAKAGVDSLDTYFAEMQGNAVRSMDVLADKMRKVYEYEPPKASSFMTERQKKKKSVLKTGEGDGDKPEYNNKFTVSYEKLPPATMRDPYADITSSLEEMFRTLEMTDDELEVHNKLMDFKKQLPSVEEQNGLLITMKNTLREIDEAQAGKTSLTSFEVQQRQKLVEEIERQKAIVDSMTASNKKDTDNIERQLELIQKRGRIREIEKNITESKSGNFYRTLEDMKSARGTREEKSDYLVRENKDLFAGTRNAHEEQTRSYEQMHMKLKALKREGWLDDESYAKARYNLWAKQNKVQLDGVEETMGNLAELQNSSNHKMAAAGKTAAEFQVAYNGVRAISEAWASAPWPYNGPAVAAATTAFAVQEAELNNLAGFAFGGGFTVGGTGGIDSQTVAFRATPGEQVTITTPEQRAAASSSQTVVHYHYNDYVEGGNKADREARFVQFQRAMASASQSRTSSLAQVAIP